MQHEVQPWLGVGRIGTSTGGRLNNVTDNTSELENQIQALINVIIKNILRISVYV